MSLDLRLRIILIVATLISAILVVRISLKAKMEIRDAANWLVVAVFFLAAALFPDLVVWVSGLVGIQVPSNAVFAALIFLAMCLIFYLSLRLSRQSAQIRELVQRMALLEKKMREQDRS